MGKARSAAVAITAVTALFNLPTALIAPPSDLPTPLAWTATAFGIAGVVIVVAMVRHVTWARDSLVALGALNAAAGVAAVLAGNPVGVAWAALGIAAVVSGSRASVADDETTVAD